MRKYIYRLFALIFFNKKEKAVAKAINYSGALLLNYIVQRIFGHCGRVEYSVHYTSRISENKQGLLIENDSISVLKSLAVSGGCYIGIHNGTTLSIGEGTIWAYGVSIVTGNHDLMDRNRYLVKDVVIGRNCWLAKGVCIMPGVILGDNVTVGANAVVTKSFPDNVILGGVPAKVIKTID